MLVHVVEDVVDRSVRPRGLAGFVGWDVGFGVFVGRSELLEVIGTYLFLWCSCIFVLSLLFAVLLLTLGR